MVTVVLAGVVVALLAAIGGLLVVWRRECARADRAERLALLDPVTGLASFRGWRQALRDGQARLDRYRHALAVVVIDMDQFKQINDAHGHHVGNDALRTVAEVLRGAARTGDVVARTGGDEFAILANATLSDAHALLERVQRALGEAGLSATGSAAAAQDAASVSEAWRQADIAAMAAKRRDAGARP